MIPVILLAMGLLPLLLGLLLNWCMMTLDAVTPVFAEMLVLPVTGVEEWSCTIAL